jgi:predicted MFS family arabinose efflux permease
VLVAITLVVAVISSLGAPLVAPLATSLHITLASAQWSLTAALLAGTVAAPVLGRLGDGAHRRETILIVLAVVSAGGIIASRAESIGALIGGRLRGRVRARVRCDGRGPLRPTGLRA